MSAPLLAIGIGCKSGVSSEDVVRLVKKACGQIDQSFEDPLILKRMKSMRLEGSVDMQLLSPSCLETQPAALYTAEDKHREAALSEAALCLGLPLVYLPRAALKAHASRAATTSQRVMALFGLPSIAETAALAGAGPGSRLLLNRIASDGVTCAIAIKDSSVSKDHS